MPRGTWGQNPAYRPTRPSSTADQRLCGQRWASVRAESATRPRTESTAALVRSSESGTDRGHVTAAELAAAARTDERYTREWCEQQAAAGLLTVADADRAPGERRFALPSGSVAVLLDPEIDNDMFRFNRLGG